MEMINQIRESYGFPQALLAQYVSVSRGHLSMAAIGRKQLQTPAFLKLSKLALAVKNEGAPELENIKANQRPFLTEREEGFLKHKILETHHRLVGCQRKLHSMQIKYRQAINALACLAVLQANPEDPDTIHYTIMEIYARNVLDKNSEAAQFDLELRIAGLEATAEFLRQRVAARESQAVVPANPEAANMEPVKPVKMVAGVQLDNKSEVAQVEPAARTESKEAKAASLPARPSVENSLAAIPTYPEDLHLNQDMLMGMTARQRLYKNNELTQFDVELNTGGLNDRADFSQSRLRMQIHRRRGGKPIDQQSPGHYLFRPTRVPWLIRAPRHPTLLG
jgi:transcriptional regulator with XRE-family HTH domain